MNDHCLESEDGQHEMNATVGELLAVGVVSEDATSGELRIVVDVTCRYCGHSGAFAFAASDVQW